MPSPSNASSNKIAAPYTFASYHLIETHNAGCYSFHTLDQNNTVKESSPDVDIIFLQVLSNKKDGGVSGDHFDTP